MAPFLEHRLDSLFFVSVIIGIYFTGSSLSRLSAKENHGNILHRLWAFAGCIYLTIFIRHSMILKTFF